MEKVGTTLKRMLPKSNLFKPRHCEREDYLVCRSNEKGPCDRQGVRYEIKCARCDNVYMAEKSRSAYARGIEHMNSLNKEEERSVLGKHCRDKHGSEVQNFRMSGTGIYTNNAILRQICESVKISKVPESALMNLKPD